MTQPALQLQILGSSSSGNCSLLTTADTKILIDAGFTGRKICERLEAIGERPEDIDAVILTHEHNDHASGLRGLARFANIEFLANRGTQRSVERRLTRPVNWLTFETNRNFRFRDLTIYPFDVPHDAVDPVGLFFQVGEDPRESNSAQRELFSSEVTRLTWCTDLGYTTPKIRRAIAKSQLVVLESNHCDILLEQDTIRPWSVKQRIRGRHGHLSNRSAAESLEKALIEVEDTWTREVVLAHLSRDCNHNDAVESAFAEVSGKLSQVRITDPTAEEPAAAICA